MKRAILDASLGSLADVYARLARDLAFPRHFGGNLDALWDVLTTDVAGPVEIVWVDHAEARRRLGADFDRIVAVLRDVEAERGDVRLRLE
jgi:ribonuclease inhibitor